MVCTQGSYYRLMAFTCRGSKGFCIDNQAASPGLPYLCYQAQTL